MSVRNPNAGGASTNVFKTNYLLQTTVGANTAIDDGMISPSASLIKKGILLLTQITQLGCFRRTMMTQAFRQLRPLPARRIQAAAHAFFTRLTI